MTEIWLAFIVACTNPNCDGIKIYGKSDKAHFNKQLCLDHAKTWAIFTKLENKKDYGYGCELNTFEPKELK